MSEEVIEVYNPIVTIGYPANDRINIRDDGGTEGILALDRYFNGIYDVKRVQPGFVLNSDTRLLTYDSTTLNKNSGSVVIDIATGKAAGIHFAGKYGIHNMAIPSTVLAEELSTI